MVSMLFSPPGGEAYPFAIILEMIGCLRLQHRGHREHRGKCDEANPFLLLSVASVFSVLKAFS
jgi:hypothetical protein